MKRIAAAVMAAFVFLGISLIFSPVRKAAAQAYNIFTSEWIQGSLIDSTPIGSTTPSTGAFTTLAASGGGTLNGTYAGSPTFSGSTTFSSLITGSISGNAGTATTLAAAPTQCAYGFSTGIQANGTANCQSFRKWTTSGCAFSADTNGSTCTQTVTIPNGGFANSTYAVTCQPYVNNGTNNSSGFAMVVYGSKTTTTFQLYLVEAYGNNAGAGNFWSAIDCIAID